MSYDWVDGSSYHMEGGSIMNLKLELEERAANDAVVGAELTVIINDGVVVDNSKLST